MKAHYVAQRSAPSTICGRKVIYTSAGREYMLDVRASEAAWVEVPADKRCARCQRCLDALGSKLVAAIAALPSGDL